MKATFILSLLLLAGTAGAQFEEQIQKHNLAVMARQQVTMLPIETKYSIEGKVYALELRLDSLCLTVEKLTVELRSQSKTLNMHNQCFKAQNINMLDLISYRVLPLESNAEEQTARIDSLEARMSRAHIVAVQDSEYVKVETFLTGGMTASKDTVCLLPKWQWEKRTRYKISFEPEVKK